ncbi:ATP-binding protein [Candidatus Gracilibacteria bacterium]|nr:ATP-binding protein [Candidatus Gracilibacteria bacterium]
MSSPKDSGFDAFFQAVTTSPEFKSAVTKDWKGDSVDLLEKSLLEMQSGVEKASSMMNTFNEKFATDEAKNIGNNASVGTNNSATHPPKTGNAKDETEKPAIEVQHFTQVEGKPWGFEAVAGMDSLKEELKDSFIKPLKFKFLVEKLRKEKGSHSEFVPESSNTEESKKNNEDAELNSAGQEKNKSELLERLYAEYEKFKISIPTGMLFYGPPGTGKTFITKKLAEELGCGFISKNMGEFGSSYLHQTTKNIKDFFEGAKKAAENEPIILFLDEIDSLVSARTSNVDANKAEEVSQFLQEFNGLESAPNLIVIAATNRPDHLDSAILRSGRLDKKIYLGPPDDIARKALFQMYIEKKGRPSEKLDYDELTILTKDYVSADIEAICDEVARDASRNLLELIDEAESGKLTEKLLQGNKITMDSLRKTILETPSSLKMVDMSIYTSWLEKIK